MGALRNLLASLLTFALNNFDNMVQNAIDILADPAALGAWNAIEQFAYTVFRPFALIIIAICLLIELANVTARIDQLKWEHILKVLVKMALSVAALQIAPTLLLAMYAQSVEWITAAAAFGGGSDIGRLVANNAGPLIENVSGFWATVGMFISLIVLVLAVQICGIIIAVIAFGRIFELYVYLAISPIPIAFFPLGDGSGGGFSRITAKFLRAFAAISLQGVLMVVCLRVFGMIMQAVIEANIYSIYTAGTTGAEGVNQMIFAFLLGAIALVMSVVKCGSWAKSILDAT